MDILPSPDMDMTQPYPLDCLVARFDGVTSIARVWEPGAPERCRLCPECSAIGDTLCLVSTHERVADGDGWLFRLGKATTLAPAMCVGGA